MPLIHPKGVQQVASCKLYTCTAIKNTDIYTDYCCTKSVNIWLLMTYNLGGGGISVVKYPIANSIGEGHVYSCFKNMKSSEDTIVDLLEVAFEVRHFQLIKQSSLSLQYKFVVDGEWRHDEHQPSVNSNIGTVNTILLTREPDYVASMLSPHAPPAHGSSMEVDNEGFQRVVWNHCTHLYFLHCCTPYPELSHSNFF